MMKHVVIIATLALGMTGCATNTAYIDAADKSSNISAGLTYADFKGAADAMADEIIASEHIKAYNPTGRIFLTVSVVENDTMQRIDTAQLTKTLRKRLTNSGRFAITNAFGENRNTDVGKFHKSGELGESKIVRQDTLQEDQSVYAPEYSLTGTIMQRDNTLDNGDTRIEYYFQLSITNLRNGLSYYEGEEVVGKVADGDSVSW